MKDYCVLVQASPEEILHAQHPGDLNLLQLQQWPRIRQVLVLLPDMQGADEARQRLALWNIPTYVGDTYNICRRMVAAQRSLSGETFAVRVLAIWKHLDLSFVDCLVDRIQESNLDAVLAPRDFDITFAADVASLEALGRIADLPGDSQEVMRARFNPWGYMDMHPESFRTEYLEPAPLYDSQKREAVLSSRRCHPENEFFGRDYAGSRYHFLKPHIPQGMRILDIACGSGAGSHLLSDGAQFVLGVDYLQGYIDVARKRYPEGARLQFSVGDGHDFLYQNCEGWFDVAVSLHTLEHVPDDRRMIANLHRNLRTGGLLVAEVPLLQARPLGVPINPYHLREYRAEEFLAMVQEAGFRVEQVYGSCRSFYGVPELARDALQVHAVKL